MVRLSGGYGTSGKGGTGERREKVEREDYQYESPTLKAVRNALYSMLNGHYRNPGILLSPMRFAMGKELSYCTYRTNE